MMKIILCTCLALVAITLHGCGGGGSDTTTTTTSTAPAAPMITTSPYSFPDKDAADANGTLVLTWKAGAADTIEVTLTANYTGTLTPGWLGFGISSDGMMTNGDYVVGYANCVRTAANGAKGSAPDQAATFNISDSSFSLEGKIMTLKFTRTLAGGQNPITAAGSYVITAAGSTAATPANCTAALGMPNIHDMHNYVHPGTKFGLVAAKQVMAVV